MNARAERFPLFDGLRAVAALSVLVYHAGYFASFSGRARSVTQYTGRLDVGVTVFFLISGFLLYRPFVRSRLHADKMPPVGAYAWRRFLRIVPAYWVALTIVAVWLSLPGVFTPSGAASYYGFAQIYDARYAVGGIGQAWTLCVEVTFYAFLPLWALAVRHIGARVDARRRLIVELAALAVLFAAGTAYQLWAVSQASLNSLTSLPYVMPLPNFVDQFAIGMAVAVVSVWYEGRALPGPLRLLRRRPLLGWALSLASFWAVSTQIGLNGDYQPRWRPSIFFERHELYTLVAVGLLLPAVFAETDRGLVGRLLGSRAVRYIGLISYGFYLYHLAVVRQLRAWFATSVGGGFGTHFAVYVVGGLVGATAIASISYYVVERPALRLKRLVSPMRGVTQGEAIVEPAPAAPPTLSRGA